MLILYTRTPSSNRLKAFGVEFELSTPALVVFLAGCALLVAPFFVPQPDVSSAGTTSAESSAEAGGQTSAATQGVGDAGSVRNGDVSEAATVVCETGAEVGLEVGVISMAETLVRLSVRLRNLSSEETVSINQYYSPKVTDAAGGQLKSLPSSGEWDPDDLEPNSYYGGIIAFRPDEGSTMPDRVSVRVPERALHNRCPAVSAELPLRDDE